MTKKRYNPNGEAKGAVWKAACEDCGAEFDAKYRRAGAVLCPKCLEARRRGEAKKTTVANTGLAAIAVRAREAHMTYGQYVAAMQRGGTKK